MQDTNDRKYRVLFATKLAREGLDITHLDTLILATPKRAKGATTQEVGRIMRSCEGKTEAKVIDSLDDKLGIFRIILVVKALIFLYCLERIIVKTYTNALKMWGLLNLMDHTLNMQMSG